MKKCPHKNGQPKDIDAARQSCGYKPKKHYKVCLFYRPDIDDGCDRCPNYQYPFDGTNKEKENEKDDDPSNPGTIFC